MYAAGVGMYTIANKAAKHMRVQVDQARRDKVATDIDDVGGFLPSDVCCDVRNFAILHGHIENAVETGRRVHHPAPGQQEIVHVSPHVF